MNMDMTDEERYIRDDMMVLEIELEVVTDDAELTALKRNMVKEYLEMRIMKMKKQIAKINDVPVGVLFDLED